MIWAALLGAIVVMVFTIGVSGFDIGRQCRKVRRLIESMSHTHQRAAIHLVRAREQRDRLQRVRTELLRGGDPGPLIRQVQADLDEVDDVARVAAQNAEEARASVEELQALQIHIAARLQALYRRFPTFSVLLRLIIRDGSPPLIRPPAMRLDRVMKFLFSRKTYERVFAPARADLVSEWRDAVIAGEIWRARWVKHVLSPWTMLTHFWCQLPTSLLKRVVEMAKRLVP